jgi:hypothetical protein
MYFERWEEDCGGAQSNHKCSLGFATASVRVKAFFGPPNFAFLSFAQVPGAINDSGFDGVAAATSICQREAQDFKSSHGWPLDPFSFIAFLNGPAAELQSSRGWVRLHDGLPFVQDLWSLSVARVYNPLTPPDGLVKFTAVWTGSNADGSSEVDGTPLSNCHSWEMDQAMGTIGDSSFVGSRWSNIGEISCNNTAGLYCLQTGKSVHVEPPPPGPETPARFVFLSPNDVPADSAADEANCQVQEAMGLPANATFRPFLARNGQSAADRFPGALSHHGRPVMRPDGVLVARNWPEFLDGILLAPINLMAGTATGGEAYVNHASVWTGALSPIEASSAVGSCNDWNTSDETFSGVVGTSAAWDARFFSEVDRSCSNPARVYCVQCFPNVADDCPPLN